jgi:hypothetical protein
VPGDLEPELRATLKRTIDGSFLAGLRRVMTVATALAWLSTLVAWRSIQGKATARG